MHNESRYMSIEASPPLTAGPVENSVAYKLRLAQIAAYRAFEERVSGYGVAPRYLGLLSIIGANPGQPQSRLAEAIALQRSSLVAILDRLEADGLLERRAADSDRRSKAVWLTQAGRALLNELSALASRHEERLCQGPLDVGARPGGRRPHPDHRKPPRDKLP